MMIAKTSIPQESLLSLDNNVFDYVDSYQCDFTDRSASTDAAKVGKLFFSSGPSWAGALFAFRNKLVKLFGLKTPGDMSEPERRLDAFKCGKGERLGLFEVFEKTESEVILGEDDRHLDFRVSLLLGNVPGSRGRRSLTITTTVKFNNVFGRIYFFPVRPFHKLIVPAMLKRIVRQIEGGQQSVSK